MSKYYDYFQEQEHNPDEVTSLSSKVCKFFYFLWWSINRPPFLRASIKRKFFIYGF